MIEKIVCKGQDWNVVKEFGGWTIGILRYSERFSQFAELERHMETDELFVLLEGSATLYTDTEECPMEQNALYNIPKGQWHHIVVSPDATVMVVESTGTTLQNTERRKVTQPC